MGGCRRVTEGSYFLLQLVVDVGVELRGHRLALRIEQLMARLIRVEGSFSCITHRITLLMLLDQLLLLVSDYLDGGFYTCYGN